MRDWACLACAMLLAVSLSGCLYTTERDDKPEDQGFHTSTLRITPNGEFRFIGNSNLSVVVTGMFNDGDVVYWDHVWLEITQGSTVDTIAEVHKWNGTRSYEMTGWYIKGDGTKEDRVEVGDTLVVSPYEKEDTGTMDGAFKVMLRTDKPTYYGTYNLTLERFTFGPLFVHFKQLSLQKRPGTMVWDVDFQLADIDPYHSSIDADNWSVRIERGPGEEMTAVSRGYPFTDFENRTISGLVYYHQSSVPMHSLSIGDLFAVACLTEEYEGGCVFLMWWDHQLGAFPLPDEFG